MSNETKKICSSCSLEKELTYFHFDNFHKRYIAKCKPCLNEYQKQWIVNYSKTAKGKEALRRATAKSLEKFPEKWKARRILKEEIRLGNIIKPKYCQGCLIENTRIEGHHENYSKPVDVEWLCTRCHATKHRI